MATGYSKEYITSNGINNRKVIEDINAKMTVPGKDEVSFKDLGCREENGAENTTK